jgi:DNA (cytosine-5)-methyltransferase 1
MRVLDLFSGLGGFSLGLERAGMQTVAFCEIDPFCRQVLRKHWPDVPQFEDIRTLKGEQVGPVDLICGGYPCQPFSTAGERRGAEDDRHLWPEMRRLVEELRPAWVLGENVAGHITLGLDQVLSDLDALGYATRAFVIPACAVDARHRRDRVWPVANASSLGLEKQGGMGKRERPTQEGNRQANHAVDGCRWPAEPRVGRVAPRVPQRVDRLKALGNSVVPQVVELIGRAIMEAAQ